MSRILTQATTRLCLPILGGSKEGIVVGNDDSVNKTANTALNEFTSTEEGRVFLSKYGKKGDKVRNQTFTEDGEYHKKGLDLIFEFNRIAPKGKTDKVIKDGRGQIIVTIDNSTYIDSLDGVIYDMRGPIMNKYSEKYRKAVIGRGIIIVHKTFIHVFGFTEDYLKDGSFNYSHIDPKIKNTYSLRQAPHWDHYNIQAGANKSKQLFDTNDFNAVKQFNSRINFGTHYSDSNLEKMMWNFSGSWKR